MRATRNHHARPDGARGRRLGNNVRRAGVIVVLTAFCLIIMFALVAFAVDTGLMSMSKTNLQNAADAASLAAAQELSAAIAEAAESNQAGDLDENSYAVARARDMAFTVAEHNGVYIDKDRDVEFGRRQYDADSGTWSIVWGEAPYNVARVTPRRDNPDLSQPDGAVKLSFGWAAGKATFDVTASASAFVESRDMVLVMDFSGSMNDDSTFAALGKIDREALLDNMEEIWTALGPPAHGALPVTPIWLTVPGTVADPSVSVTFKDTQVYVEASRDLDQVRLVFDDQTEQTLGGLSGMTGTFAGTDDNLGKPIATVFVKCDSEAVEPDPLTLIGVAPTSNKLPQIKVTFDSDTVYIESSKDLSNVVLEFTNGAHYKFDGLTGKIGTFTGQGANTGLFITRCWVKSAANFSNDGPGYGERFVNTQEQSSGQEFPEERFDDSYDNIKAVFGLTNVAYPYPSGSWDGFIGHCRVDSTVNSAGFKKKYGALNFVNYLLRDKPRFSQTPDLWKTPHYPFHAIKEGATLFTEFLSDLGYGDELGLVSYDDSSRVETTLSFDGYNIDLSSDPITSDLEAINQIQRHKQASHYYSYTGMGYGIRDGRHLLFGNPDASPATTGHLRTGARPTLIVMTDGLANRHPSNWRLPHDFDWDAWTDFDGDGDADYSTSNRSKQYAFWQATQAIESGATIHTLSVGVDGDRDLMEAIAFAGKGEFMDIPGGSNAAAMEAQLLAAFAKIGASVPPAKLINPDVLESE